MKVLLPWYRELVWRTLDSGPLKPLALRARTLVRRRRREALKRLKATALARHGTVSPAELLEVLRRFDVREGDVVFMQTSFNNLITFGGGPADLIGVFRSLVGETGTLLAPAAPMYDTSKPDAIFDVNTTPTWTGIVNEIFRRSTATVRSAHPRQSVAGVGPLAESLLSGHENCYPANGPDSPFDRLRRLDRAWIVAPGFRRGWLAMLHWLEDIEPERFPFPVHADAPSVRRVRMPDGEIRVVRDLERSMLSNWHIDLPWMARHLTPAAVRFERYKEIDIAVYPVRRLAAELLALRDAGIVHYR